MKLSFESKGDFDGITKWLGSVIKRDPTVALNQIASEGKRSLASNTPRDTGETASGWESKVTKKGNTAEIAWTNNAHPEAEVNLAKLIELGHGTRTGGYVAPRPYVKRSMDPVFNTAGDKLAKEMFK